MQLQAELIDTRCNVKKTCHLMVKPSSKRKVVAHEFQYLTLSGLPLMYVEYGSISSVTFSVIHYLMIMIYNVKFVTYMCAVKLSSVVLVNGSLNSKINLYCAFCFGFNLCDGVTGI